MHAFHTYVIITLMRYFLIPKSRDLVSHNPDISGLKTVRDPGIPESGIPFAIPRYVHYRPLTSFFRFLKKSSISKRRSFKDEWCPNLGQNLGAFTPPPVKILEGWEKFSLLFEKFSHGRHRRLKNGERPSSRSLTLSACVNKAREQNIRPCFARPN